MRLCCSWTVKGRHFSVCLGIIPDAMLANQIDRILDPFYRFGVPRDSAHVEFKCDEEKVPDECVVAVGKLWRAMPSRRLTGAAIPSEAKLAMVYPS